jgi:hypothetical protein
MVLMYDSTIKWLPSKSNDVCLAIFQEIHHNDPSGIRTGNATGTSDIGKSILQRSRSAGVSAGRKSDQWSNIENYLVSNPKLFPTNTFKSVLVENLFETCFYSKYVVHVVAHSLPNQKNLFTHFVDDTTHTTEHKHSSTWTIDWSHCYSMLLMCR